MDKNVKYALLGGLALVGAALAYHFYKQQVDNEDDLDEDINELGAIEYENDGKVIKFEQFIKIFKLCS